MKNWPKKYFLLNVKRKIGINAYFLKYFDPLQAIEIKVRSVGNCCEQAIFKPDNTEYQ
jgi:hypothetical protein